MKRIAKLRPAMAAFLMMISVATTSRAISFLNQPVSAYLQVGMSALLYITA